MVTLYTRQHSQSLTVLEQDGVIVNHRQYIRAQLGDLTDYFCQKYDYFVEMAQKIVAKPLNVQYPIWCAISKENCLRAGEQQVVYQLNVPPEEVIYFDSVKWDYVLNDLYIPKDKADEKRYLAMLKRRGIENQFSFLRGRYGGHYPDIEQKIIDSWQRIFEIDRWDPFSVQANIWQIKRAWVSRVIRRGETL